MAQARQPAATSSLLRSLLASAGEARFTVLARTAGLDDDAGAWQPAEDEWSTQAIVEHLVLAEQSGVQFVWRAIRGVQAGTPLWTGEPVHRGLPIADVIARTWRFREEAPPNATPQQAAPLSYWRAVFEAQQPVLAALAQELAGLDLETVIYPHFLSGPLDARQRLEFITWHIAHHRQQLDALLAALPAPGG
ncbi:MAG TPA: DinB family protein [Dehalococcoidia bacterium]|nr:DinB family protein [Dehalococcoidia bacterium]